jgi:hypothetical protein
MERYRSRGGQGYLGLVAALVLVSVMTYLEFGMGGTSGVSSSRSNTSTTLGSSGNGGVSGSGGYGGVIKAAKGAADGQSKPDAYSGANSGLIPTTTQATDPPVSYAAPSGGPGALNARSVVTLATKVATFAHQMAGTQSVDAINTAVGQTYLRLAFVDIASSSGATLVGQATGWTLSSNNAKWAACIHPAQAGNMPLVTAGRCS